MRLHLLLTVIIFSLVGTLSACSHASPPAAPSTTANNQLPPPALEQPSPPVQDAIDSVGDAILKDSKFRICMARSTQSCTSEVISEYARGDTAEVCKNFKDSSLVTTCTSAVTTEIARKAGDSTLCNSLPADSKMICAEQAIIAGAVARKDIKLCEGITTSWKTADAKDRCRIQVIMVSPMGEDTKKLCATIESEMTRTMCTQDTDRRIEMDKRMKDIGKIK